METAEDVDVSPHDSASQSGRRSHASSSSSVGRRRAEITARRAALQARAAIDEQRRQLELQQLTLQQHREQLETEAELAALAAEDEVLASSHVGSIVESAVSPVEDVALVPPGTEATTSKSAPPVNNSAADDDDNEVIIPRLRTAASLNLPKAHKSDIQPRRAYDMGAVQEDGVVGAQMTTSGLDSSATRVNIRPSNSTGSCGNSSDLISLIEAMKMPSVQLMSFSGDPLQYYPFLQSFDNTVGRCAVDDAAKLSRLLQYCSGPARQVIECCAIMPPDSGYAKARELLKERFGDTFQILQMWIKKVTTGPQVKANASQQLRQLADDLVCCRETLSAMGAFHEINNQATLLRIVERLPPFLQNRWKREVRAVRLKQRIPNFNDVVTFVADAAAEMTDSVYGNLGFPQNSSERHLGGVGRRSTVAIAGSTSLSTPVSGQNHNVRMEPVCPFCGGCHRLYKCERFKELPVGDRSGFVRERKLCFNCLSEDHKAKKCRLNRVCQIQGCGKRHSPLLHAVQWQQPGSTNQPAARENIVNNSSQTSASQGVLTRDVIGAGASTRQRCCLPIVPVIVRNPNSRQEIHTYALLDSGSTNSFCSDSVAQQLGLKSSSEAITLSLTTLTATNAVLMTAIVAVEVCDLQRQITVDLPSVLIKDDLTLNISSKGKTADISRWQHLRDIELPELSCDQVGLLIGQDAPDVLLPVEVRRGEVGSPIAVKTVFGWTISGPLSSGTSRVVSHFATGDARLQMETFWRSEVMPSLQDCEYGTSYSVDDLQALKLWNDTITVIDGHYCLHIPFKHYPPQMPNNTVMARQRLESLKRRLCRDENLASAYCKNMDELFDKGYAEAVPEDVNGSSSGSWYLPHHPVLNENKPGKVRIVFDCAAVHHGISLNSVVLQGPDMTNALTGVLLRFRLEKVALMADIEAMFYQVKVSEQQRDYLRFLWWPGGNFSEEPQHFRMTVHLFGGVWSPSCCNFVLRYTAQQQRDRYSPEIVSAVDKNFYVDDFLKAVPSVEDAVATVQEVSQLLRHGGFHLTKWVSNSSEVLDTIPTSEVSSKLLSYELTGDSIAERALGVRWYVDADSFGFSSAIRDKPDTRRGILSTINAVYDPLGLVSPFILPAKRLLQELCRRRVSWDDRISGPDLEAWTAWKRDLPQLEQLRIRRCIKPDDVCVRSKPQLHHFCDASSYGYGCTTYVRAIDQHGNASCQLLMAKSRLAPMKTMTIPRLELCAAALAYKMNGMISSELDVPLQTPVFWTDSTIVLQYIVNTSKRFHTFVANRISAIRGGSDPTQWRHVDSESNPADDVSRGLRASELVRSTRWFEGPEFLRHDEAQWPTNPVYMGDLPETDPEIRRNPVVYSAVSTGDDIFDTLFQRRSGWYELKRDFAWLLRVRAWLKARISRLNPPMDMRIPISASELYSAEIEIVKLIQRKSYTNEVRALMASDPEPVNDVIGAVGRHSQLYKLEPVMTSDGVMRVGGRLPAHPAILPRHHPVVDLIVRYYHTASGHVGREHVLSLCRQKYWIVGARSAVRRILKNCTACRARRAVPMCQRMADLPGDRVAAGQPPFTGTGVDLFGPFIVKRGRVELKRYGCLFTCLAVRAVHIEVVQSLDTDSFINAFQRFICRRGQVRLMRSDNGTNFVGTVKELNIDQNRMNDFLRRRSIEWHFNPPTASHMGGVWERQVRTVRKVLDGVMKQQTLDDEGLSTLLCLVESVVNSRPLTIISDDVNDLNPLTPNHLLLLQSGAAPLLTETAQQDVYSRKRWRQVQYLANIFWKRWTREYLPTLSLRQKWTKAQRNVKVGDTVIIIDENLPRGTWSLGRVIETFPGADGMVRSVRLRTKSATLIRPIHKLCLLEAADTE